MSKYDIIHLLHAGEGNVKMYSPGVKVKAAIPVCCGESDVLNNR